MFERSKVQEKPRPLSFYMKIGVVLLLVLAGIAIFRVNNRREPIHQIKIAVEDTKGPLVETPVNLEAGEFAPYRMSFPYRSTLSGNFRARDRENWPTVLVLDEQNFNIWKTGENFQAATTTGKVPGGNIHRVLESGTYYLVFSNREGKTPQTIDANFRVE